MRLLRFHSRRERNLWLLAAGYTLVLYSTLALVRGLTNFLRPRGLLRPTLWVLLAGAVVAAVVWILRGRPRAREWAVLGLVALGYLLVIPLARAPEEKFHLLEYGLLAGVIYAALSERRAALSEPTPSFFLRHLPLTAFLLTAALGFLDELLQGLLPSRYYDTRDVLLNALAGGLVIAALAGREWARRRAL